MTIERVLLHPYFLIATVGFAFFFNLWGIPLFDLDEGAFAEATREMLESGNFAATYLDGAPRYDKPILSYWFQALSVSLFGLNEFAFRLPSAIAASIWLLAVHRFAKAQWDDKTATIAVLIMANTLWVGLIGRAAIADAWLNLFISLAMFDIWRYWQQRKLILMWRAFLWIGLGILTKGPVAALIPLLTSALLFGSYGQLLAWLRAIFNPLGWAILLVVLGPWLFLVYQDQGAGFFYGFLVEHNLNRFNATKEGHGGQWYYYAIALPIVLMPFSGALYKLVGAIRTLAQSPLERFLIAWFLVVFVLVSVSQTQLPHYVLYGCTGLFLIFAKHRDKLLSGSWQLAFPLVFFLLMLVLPAILDMAASESRRQYEKDLLGQGEQIFSAYYWVVTAICLLTVSVIALSKQISHYQKLIAVGVVQTLFVFTVFIQVVADFQQTPVKQAAEIAKQYPDRTVVAYGIRMPSFSVYRQAITARRLPEYGELVFTRSDKLTALKEELGTDVLHVLYNQGGIMLVERRHD